MKDNRRFGRRFGRRIIRSAPLIAFLFILGLSGCVKDPPEQRPPVAFKPERTPSGECRERWSIWNVGQGLWVTWITPEFCWHFDLGGEKAPWRKIIESCGNKQMNLISFSHWDWDHVGFARRAARRLKQVCLRHRPGGSPPDKRKNWLSGIPLCAEMMSKSPPLKNSNPSRFAALFGTVEEVFADKSTSGPRQKDQANTKSRVFLLRKQDRSLLLPGDSTSKQEMFWSRRLSRNSVRYLALGHHGSQTSTSMSLLQALPHLRQAIASARRAKYGHPHRRVSLRLKRAGVALLRTEDWGSIHFEQQSSRFEQCAFLERRKGRREPDCRRDREKPCRSAFFPEAAEPAG